MKILFHYAESPLVRDKVIQFLYEEKQIPSKEFVENWSNELLYTLYKRYCDVLESERKKQLEEETLE